MNGKFEPESSYTESGPNGVKRFKVVPRMTKFGPDVDVSAECDCGGTMVRLGTKMEWVCNKKRWYKPWVKHAMHY